MTTTHDTTGCTQRPYGDAHDAFIIANDTARQIWITGFHDGYQTGAAATVEEAQTRAQHRVQEEISEVWELGCHKVHPAVTDSVARMFPGWDGEAMAHAQSVQDFRAAHVPEAASSPKCDCGDWARGYAHRDTMNQNMEVAQ